MLIVKEAERNCAQGDTSKSECKMLSSLGY